MTEESDSILPVGASSSSGFSGSRVDVIHAPQPIPPVRPSQRPAPSPAAGAAGGSPGGGAASRPTPAQAAQSLQESVDRLNARLASSNRVVQLRVDAATGITIAEIKDSATGEVVQQIPGTDIVHLAEMLSAWAHGKNVLVDLIA
jgi:FlaG protein